MDSIYAILQGIRPRGAGKGPNSGRNPPDGRKGNREEEVYLILKVPITGGAGLASPELIVGATLTGLSSITPVSNGMP